jgi:putative endonuclease
MYKTTSPSMDHAALFSLAELAQQKAVQRRKKALASLHGRLSRKQAGAEKRPPPNRSPRQRQGDLYEARALEYLQGAGCVLLERQLCCPAGELDLVVRDGSTLVFVEVRQRASNAYGGASASVTPAKQRRIRLAARYFFSRLVQQHFKGATPYCRFDLLAFEPPGLTWHRDAFRLTLDK